MSVGAEISSSRSRVEDLLRQTSLALLPCSQAPLNISRLFVAFPKQPHLPCPSIVTHLTLYWLAWRTVLQILSNLIEFFIKCSYPKTGWRTVLQIFSSLIEFFIKCSHTKIFKVFRKKWHCSNVTFLVTIFNHLYVCPSSGLLSANWLFYPVAILPSLTILSYVLSPHL